MTRPEDRARQDAARAGFVRLMIYTVVTGVLMVAGALVYLALSAGLTVTMVIATTVGVFLSVLLGAGLMALGFLSSNSGHDEEAANAAHQDDPRR